MSPAVEIEVYEKSGGDSTPRLVATVPLAGRTEFGRQETTAEPLFVADWREANRHWRVVVARGAEQTVGRHHLVIEDLPGGRVQITNTSTRSTVQIDNGPSLARGVPFTAEVPADGLLLQLGSTRVVRLRRAGQLDDGLAHLPRKTVPPEEYSSPTAAPVSLALPPDPGIDGEALVGWLQTALGLLQSAANSPDLFPRVAQAVVDLAAMDSGRVLLLEQGTWREQARAFPSGSPLAGTRSGGLALPGPDPLWQPSRRVLDRVRVEKTTFWELPRLLSPDSMVGVQAVIAAPILDQKGEVLGVLYGDRRQTGRPIGRVEAMLVELLACGVASRLARLKEEQARLRFEQFFTPTLARHLAAQPDLLDGRTAEVTVLFCDVRGFSRFSHRLPPPTTVAWISAVMAAMSDCVIEHGGVLVDYVGDELMAMWGAPEEQPDHAGRACDAALAMLARLPALNARWEKTLGEPMSIGVGINSGEAHVGNVGTPRKFKYGPLGNTVNLGSRVQGATKHLKTRLLLTENTFLRLPPEPQGRARRLCTVRVHNIDAAVTLYELPVAGQPAGPEWKEKYETSLAEFERQNFRVAARTLQPLIIEAVNDGPSIVLLSRAVQGLANGPAPGHPVWELPTK